MNKIEEMSNEELVNWIVVVGSVRSDICLSTEDVRNELLRRLQVRKEWPRVSPNEMRGLDEDSI